MSLPLDSALPEISPSPSPAGLGGSLSAQRTRDTAAEARYVDPTWTLVWGDDFTNDGLPDPTRWNYEQGRVRNEEAQFYVAAREANSRISGGVLQITARKEPWQDAHYTSASLTTRDRFAFTRGKLEVRARVPGGRGSWTALWLLAEDHPQVPWPQCGEIDLMEHVGFMPERFHYTVHTDAHNHMLKTQLGTFEDVAPATLAEFRDYGLIWSEDRLEWFVDGRKIFEYVNTGTGSAVWPFSRPQYLLLSLAIGGSWGGSQGIDDSIFPATLEIAHVRIWQQPEMS
jgi:beta-glucanase (GH16 family)